MMHVGYIWGFAELPRKFINCFECVPISVNQINVCMERELIIIFRDEYSLYSLLTS